MFGRETARMNQTVSLMLLLITSVAFTSYLNAGTSLPQAEAQSSINLSGKVTNSSGSPISGAFIYIEGFKTTLPYSNWKTVTTDVNGNWATSVAAGYNYNVDASKYTYSRARYGPTITTSTSNINLQINSQAAKVLDLFVAPDEEFRNYYASWQSTAWSKVSSKQSFYKDNYNVQFNQKVMSSAWNSPNATVECGSLLSDLKSDTGWSGGQYQNADTLFGLTRQTQMTVGGQPADGCGDVPGSGGQHPGAIVNDYIAGSSTSDVANHEIAHNYGFNHHSSYYATTMSTGPAPKDYNQLDPNEDYSMAIAASPKRNWY